MKHARCTDCGKMFKTPNALGAHTRFKHKNCRWPVPTITKVEDGTVSAEADYSDLPPYPLDILTSCAELLAQLSVGDRVQVMKLLNMLYRS